MRIWDYAGVVEVTIESSANAIWPYFFGKKKDIWSRTEYSTVAGESGRVGEVYVMARAFHGARSYFEAIKVDPGKALVLKNHERERQPIMPDHTSANLNAVCIVIGMKLGRQLIARR